MHRSSILIVRARHTLLAAGMLVGELGQVVDILVDDDVEVVGLVVLGHIGGRE